MKSVLLIGLGRFGRHVAMQLYSHGHQVMGVDRDEKRLHGALPYVTSAQIGDSTDPEFLNSLGIPSYDVCIVAIGGCFQSSLETTSLLKELGAQLVISRAERDVQAKFLLRNGADDVVYPEKQVAKWAAIRYTADHVLEYIDLGDDNAILEVSIPKSWLGQSVGQLDIRKRYRVNILAVKRGGGIDVSITPDTVLEADQTLLVLGKYHDLQKCFRL